MYMKWTGDDKKYVFYTFGLNATLNELFGLHIKVSFLPHELIHYIKLYSFLHHLESTVITVCFWAKTIHRSVDPS